MHGDLQQNLEVLLNAKKLFDKLDEKEFNDFLALKGLRSGRSIFENIFTVGVAIFSSDIFFGEFWDIAAQPNIFKTSTLRILDKAPDDHTFEFYVYLKFKGLNGKYKRFDAF